MERSGSTLNNRGIMPRHASPTIRLRHPSRVRAGAHALACLLGLSYALGGVDAGAEADPPGAVTPAAPSQDGPTRPPLPLSVLLRTAIVTPDLAASRRFYEQGLGLRVRFDGDITRPEVLRQLNLTPGQTAWFVVLEGAKSLRGRAAEGAMVGLLHVDRPALPKPLRPAGSVLAAGDAMLAIETEEFAAVESRLRRLGAPVLVEPMRSADGSEVEMVVRDPAGVRVHVLERRAR
jgi:catechol 2,3-dioxygenase-like lactoylglutathione lyase family enzyme